MDLELGDRILIMDQYNTKDNGIYVVGGSDEIPRMPE